METFYAKDRRTWRAWLKKNHKAAREIWLVYYRKGSGEPRVSYNDAVEEALCYGWIDSIVRSVDDERFCQRFSPRKPNSKLSQMNLERVRKLVATGKMTRAGLEALAHVYDPEADDATAFRIPDDIKAALRADKFAWTNFQRFPAEYQRVRVAYVDASRNRPEFFAKRLAYLVKMSANNKRFGFVKEMR